MRKLEVLNTNYEKSGLYAKIPALNDMTLKEFFEGLNIVKNYDSVRTFNNAIETVDESILIDSSISLISGHEYFSAFDLIFKTMPVDAPDSYRLWVGSEGVTDTITHSFLTNEKEVFMNVKTSASSRTSDLYLNLFGLTIGQSMNLETDLYFIIDLTNLSFEVTEEQVYYYYRMYRYLKDSKSFEEFTYLPKGQSKYDVAYVNQTIDEPIAELNGHTLREVFEDGNEVDLSTITGSLNGISTPSYDSITKELTLASNGTVTNPYLLIRNQKISNATKYYIGIFFKTDVQIIRQNIFYVANFSSYENPSVDQWIINSDHKLTNNVYHILYWNEDMAVGATLKFKDYIAVNTEALGISLLSKTNMDYYYSLYLARKNITKKLLTYADIFEGFNTIDKPLDAFDELITQEQIDSMLAHYLLVKNIVIYPEIYVPIEPVGLGNRFKLLAVDDTVYGHELDFEDISFKMYFGVNFDAYKGYHAMMNMLRSNKAIIEYDWGIGPRYNDVRLLNAPKTEKDTSLLIISKFYFKRLNPFYELIQVSDEEDMKNESDLDSPIKLDLTVSNTTVSIKLLDASSGVQQEISFDFTGVSTPFNLTIDPETKKLLIDDITDAYDYADHSKESFIYLPGDSEIYSLNITGASVNKITYKKWVIS